MEDATTTGVQQPAHHGNSKVCQKALNSTHMMNEEAERGSDLAASSQTNDVGLYRASKVNTRRVAIIGVHGVGHHEPGATANSMANLLLSLPSHKPEEPNKVHPRSYDAFRGVGIQIPLQPVRLINTDLRAGVKKGALDFFQERSATFANRGVAVSQREPDVGATGNAYTKLLLEQYEGAADGNVYITSRLEGRRVSGSPSEPDNVDIYEVLWADLARPTNTLLSFFMALFQLILHLGSLSRLAIDSSGAEQPGKLWTVYRALQRYAVRIFQILFPLLKVIALVAIASAVPVVSPSLDGTWLPLLLGAIGGILVGFLIGLKSNRPILSNPWIWSLYALIPAGLGFGVGALLDFVVTPQIASALEIWLCIGISLLSFVLGKYEDVRKGVSATGWFVYGLFFIVFAVNLIWEPKNVPQASLWTLEWILAALRFSWWTFFICAFLALGLGSWAWRSVSNIGERARAKAAVRTSRFALALPSILWIAVTALIWAGLFRIADRVQRPFYCRSLRQIPFHGRWLASIHLIEPISVFAQGDYLRGILAWSIGYQAPVSLALFCFVLFLAVRWVLPAALTERYPLRNELKPPRSSSNEESVSMGTWSSRGLDSTSVITFLLWITVFVVPLAYYFLPSGYQLILENRTVNTVIVGGVAVASIVIAAMIKYGSSILDATLDVDTYLRATPSQATPRAQIFERYVSTLRYVANHRDSDGRGYDSVVIVAHSLGTLITADLLRFLYWDPDPELDALGFNVKANTGMERRQPRIAVKLLTMGSPLRQLLNRFFPYLYDWVRSEPDNALRPLPGPTNPVSNIADGTLPDPSQLGVTEWVNVYRSGDYVGRSIWLDEWYRRSTKKGGRYPQAIHRAHGLNRVEMCIGAGAHTHYWDDTAPDVAEQLNSML